MKALKYWALLKYLPLDLGWHIKKPNRRWDFLLHLCHMVDLIFALRLMRGMVSYMKDLTEEHLELFSVLYLHSEWGVRLRPKHHMLVHLPSINLKSRPLHGMSCMKYEMKNSFFK